MGDLYETAKTYLDAGLSVLPVMKGTKRVKNIRWKQYQSRLPTSAELETWFSGQDVGIGVVTGEISGSVDADGVVCGLEVLDCDDEATVEYFLDMAEDIGLLPLIQRLPTETTPGKGRHWAWRCSEWEGNLKLAEVLIREKPLKTKILLETRGEGGQCVIAPTPQGIHPGHPERAYELLAGDWTALPIITPEERNQILSLARSFNQYVKPSRQRGTIEFRQGPVVQGSRPGDELNQTADSQWWHDLLTRHDWTWLYDHGGVHYWKRPGKRSPGVSATIGHTGNMLYVFSTSAAPFENDRAYAPFTALSLLDFNGDFKACARSLAVARRSYAVPSGQTDRPPEYTDEQIDTMLDEVITADEATHAPMRFDLTEKGKVQECLLNYVTMFLEHHHWQGRLSYNLFAQREELDKQPLTKERRVAMAVWAAEQYGLKGSNPRMRDEAILHVCWQRTHDPLLDYVESLPPWDGNQRLDAWMAQWCGSEDTRYAGWVGRMMIVQMVARALWPGCIARYVVVLEGEEVRSKSALVREIGYPWSIVFDMSMDHKEAHMAIQGSWVAELAELDTMRRTTETRLKSFITQTEDTYVPKYSNDPVRIPRRCLFIGTTNEDEYLLSATGNTRFLPIKTDGIDIAKIKAEREQMFAEALTWLRQHESDWWEPPDVVEDVWSIERDNRRLTNVFEDTLRLWLDGYDETGAQIVDRWPLDQIHWHDIAQDFLRIDRKDWKDKSLQMQIASALRSIGWQRKVIKEGAKSKKVWVRSVTT